MFIVAWPRPSFRPPWAISKKAAAWEEDLMAAISEKTGAPLSGSRDSLKGLAGL